jgi:FKBP-type peptidyl-prolyl cis-trans isomerase SlyD
MQVAKHKVVVFDYTLTDTQGSLIEESKQSGPFAYIHGTNSIIPGLESALEGKQAGEALRVSVEPEKAYGVRDAALVAVVPRDRFESDELEVGMRFQTETQNGMRVFTVTSIEDDQVTVDGNHPLAGETLTFDVNIVEVRDASAEEISHGHVHGPGGHHH